MNLTDWGWDNIFAFHFEPFTASGWVPARVIAQFRGGYRLAAECGELWGEPSGAYLARAEGLPAVGDWTAIAPRPAENAATIHAVLPRKSQFSRKAAGRTTTEQVAAANVDTVFLVTGLDGDFNLRRIERYLTAAWDSGATPVIVLNKADACAALAAAVEAAESVAMGVPVLAVSAQDGTGVDALAAHLRPGKTAAFLGSSGVGKSSLINRLVGSARMATSAVRADDSRGRHTTTHRELIQVPGGGLLLDTPGMRELQLWADEASLEQTFGDIAALAANCRFRDCTHGEEPGCAVRAARESGQLDPARWSSYVKLRKELQFLERRQDQSLQQVEKAKWKQIHKMIRRHYKARE